MIKAQTAIKYAKALREFCSYTKCDVCPFHKHYVGGVNCATSWNIPHYWSIPESEGVTNDPANRN